MICRWDSNSSDAAELRDGLKSGKIKWKVTAGQLLTHIFPQWKGKYSNVQLRNAINTTKAKIEKERYGTGIDGNLGNADTLGNAGHNGNAGSAVRNNFAKKQKVALLNEGKYNLSII